MDSFPARRHHSTVIGVAAFSLAAVSVVMSSTTTRAADAPSPPLNPPQPLEEIVVTGTHLGNMEARNERPILVLERDDLLRSGLSGIADILQQLVINGPTLNRISNNGNAPRNSAGELLVNLRALGPSRTLVLVNGQRWVPDLNGAVDLTAIPLALVERIEVLKDGASAIYGSDAIAGVVNVITRKDYSGAELGAYIGETDQDDGLRRAFDLSIGHKDDRWSAMLGVEYSKDEPIFAGNRAISAVPLYGLPPGLTGSDFTPYTVFALEYPQSPCDPARLRLIAGRDGTSREDFRSYNCAHDNYNYAPINYLQTPQERNAAFAQGRFDLSPTLAITADLLFNRRRSEQQHAEPTIFFRADLPGPDGFGISPQNVYNPFGEEVIAARHRLSEAGPRIFEQTMDTTRLRAGLDGLSQLASRDVVWGVDILATRSSQTEFATGNADDARLVLAVGPSFFDAAGVAHCGTPDAVVAGCVPLNLFGPPGSITPAMLDYIEASARSRMRTDSRDVNVYAVSELIALPAGPASVAIGAEYRHDSGNDFPDPLIASGNANGASDTQGPTSGSYSVTEAFIELKIPLLSDARFARTLETTMGSRLSGYSSFGNTVNSQLGLRWKPLDDILVRGNYAQGFRAPSINELLGGAQVSTDFFGDGGISDPCASDQNPTPAVVARCRALGVPAMIGGTGTFSVTQGGNSSLQPEKARSRTLGVVYTPAWAEGFEASLDWYRFQIRNAIGNPGDQTVLNDCYILGDANACARITRAGDGTLYHVLDNEQNLRNGLETEGFDFSVAFRRDTSIGRLGLRWDSAYVSYFGELGQPAKFTLLADGSPALGNVVGTSSDAYGVVWRLRSTMQLTWERGPWNASITGRYFSSIDESCAAVAQSAEMANDPSLLNICSNPNHIIYIDGKPVPENRVGAVTFFDLQGGWDAPWHGSFAIGVRNAFNRNPPVSFTATNSFFSDYDVPGRFWWTSYRQKF